MGETALMWAAAENHADAVKALVELGADVNAKSKVLSFPEFKWSTSGMVSTALPRGGWTPLMHAARQGALEAGTRAGRGTAGQSQRRDPDGTTALVVAIINAHYDLAAMLLDRGADPNVTDSTGTAALYALVDMHTLAHMQGRPRPSWSTPSTRKACSGSSSPRAPTRTLASCGRCWVDTTGPAMRRSGKAPRRSCARPRPWTFRSCGHCSKPAPIPR